jgi:hypothetical protein
MYLDEIMAKEEGCFLATTQRNISAIILERIFQIFKGLI